MIIKSVASVMWNCLPSLAISQRGLTSNEDWTCGPGVPLTPSILKLIRFLINVGYGYSAFACNVKAQGWCSRAQLTVLFNMLHTLEYRENNQPRWYGRRKYGRNNHLYERDTNISDEEAMISGEFF